MNQASLLADLIARAKAAGADAADAILIAGASVSVQRRLGATEHLERSEERDLGPGNAVIARAGEEHGVRNDTTENVTLLVTMAPRPS